jgi:hypothetical protein
MSFFRTSNTHLSHSNKQERRTDDRNAKAEASNTNMSAALPYNLPDFHIPYA